MDGMIFDAAVRQAKSRGVSIIQVSKLISPTRKRLARTTVRDAVKRLSEAGRLQRIAPGVVVIGCHPNIHTLLPSTVFPWWGSKRKMAPALISLLHAELRRRKKRAIVSPFLGSGVAEGALVNRGHRVVAFDLNANIVNVHRALSNATRRAATARHFIREHNRLSRSSDTESRRAFYNRSSEK